MSAAMFCVPLQMPVPMKSSSSPHISIIRVALDL